MLQELVGLRVVKALFVVDYLQLFFEGGKCLSVYNKHRINTFDGGSENEQNLAGAALSALDENKIVIRFVFSNGLELSVDMTCDGYLGPEAMQLTRPGLPTVVWRTDD
jgi:hypothetical protein